MTHDTRYLKSDRMEEVKYIFVCNFKLKTLGFHIPVIKSKAYQDYHGLQFSQLISENSKAPGPYKDTKMSASLIIPKKTVIAKPAAPENVLKDIEEVVGMVKHVKEEKYVNILTMKKTAIVFPILKLRW